MDRGKKDKESLNNNDIIFQLVSGRARPQGSMFENLFIYLFFIQQVYLPDRDFFLPCWRDTDNRGNSPHLPSQAVLCFGETS